MNSPARSIRWGAAAAPTFYGALLYILGLHPDKELKYAFAYVPAALGYAVPLFDKWAWRWPGVHKVTGHPRLDGTWRTILVTSPKSDIPAGGNRGPITTYLTIEQSYWTLHATLRTAESSSRSTNATVEKRDGSGVTEMRFLYENTPQVVHQPRSPVHTGACRLSVAGRNPTTLTGRYYTDRFTAGDMDLVLVDRRTDYGSFTEAAAADSPAPPASVSPTPAGPWSGSPPARRQGVADTSGGVGHCCASHHAGVAFRAGRAAGVPYGAVGYYRGGMCGRYVSTRNPPKFESWALGAAWPPLWTGSG